VYGYVLGDIEDRAMIDMERLQSLLATERAAELYRSAGERGSAEGWYNRGHLLWETARSDGAERWCASTYEGSIRSSGGAAVTALEAFRITMELGDGDAAYFLHGCDGGEGTCRHGFLLLEGCGEDGGGGFGDVIFGVATEEEVEESLDGGGEAGEEGLAELCGVDDDV